MCPTLPLPLPPPPGPSRLAAVWCDWIERDGTRGGGAPGCGDEEAAWAWAWADHAGGGSGWLDAFAGLAYTGAAAGPGLAAAATFPACRGVPCAAAGVA